jgi:hypothetical protein
VPWYDYYERSLKMGLFRLCASLRHPPTPRLTFLLLSLVLCLMMIKLMMRHMMHCFFFPALLKAFWLVPQRACRLLFCSPKRFGFRA